MKNEQLLCALWRSEQGVALVLFCAAAKPGHARERLNILKAAGIGCLLQLGLVRVQLSKYLVACFFACRAVMLPPSALRGLWNAAAANTRQGYPTVKCATSGAASSGRTRARHVLNFELPAAPDALPGLPPAVPTVSQKIDV